MCHQYAWNENEKNLCKQYVDGFCQANEHWHVMKINKLIVIEIFEDFMTNKQKNFQKAFQKSFQKALKKLNCVTKLPHPSENPKSSLTRGSLHAISNVIYLSKWTGIASKIKKSLGDTYSCVKQNLFENILDENWFLSFFFGC